MVAGKLLLDLVHDSLLLMMLLLIPHPSGASSCAGAIAGRAIAVLLRVLAAGKLLLDLLLNPLLPSPTLPIILLHTTN